MLHLYFICIQYKFNAPNEKAVIKFLYLIRTGILKKQLEKYRDIIGKRVSCDNPVITYQDNMQLKRTSMRHLRLSKLQKEKLKQGKMWDFTVRGWRAATVCDIEDLFGDEQSAVLPQREIQKLKYEDTKIGKSNL